MKWNLHWLDGKVEIVEGEKISDAFTKAGYGAGAMKALDFIEDNNLVGKLAKITCENPNKGTVAKIIEQTEPGLLDEKDVYFIAIPGRGYTGMFHREDFKIV